MEAFMHLFLPGIQKQPGSLVEGSLSLPSLSSSSGLDLRTEVMGMVWFLSSVHSAISINLVVGELCDFQRSLSLCEFVSSSEN